MGQGRESNEVDITSTTTTSWCRAHADRLTSTSTTTTTAADRTPPGRRVCSVSGLLAPRCRLLNQPARAIASSSRHPACRHGPPRRRAPSPSAHPYESPVVFPAAPTGWTPSSSPNIITARKQSPRATGVQITLYGLRALTRAPTTDQGPRTQAPNPA